MYVLVTISTCGGDNTPRTTIKKDQEIEKIWEKKARCNSFACKGMTQLDSATGMHDCVVPTIAELSTSKPVTPPSAHVTRMRKPRVTYHEHTPTRPIMTLPQ